MIEVNVEIGSKSWQKEIKNPKEYFKKKLKKISKKVSFLKKKKIVFTILLTNSLKMKKLNKKFRNNNKPTDVLSFPFFTLNNLKLRTGKKIYLGDIAISYEIIKHRSKEDNFLIEFDKVWVHGFLHLLGYRHVKNRDYFRMHKSEKKILNLIY